MRLPRDFTAAHTLTRVWIAELTLVGRRVGLVGRCRCRLSRLLSTGSRSCSVLPQLANPGLPPDLAAEVVKLRAVDVADRRNLDLVDLGRVQRERPLDADAERL